MKLSANTTQILKNFSQINNNLIVKGGDKGNQIRTISVSREIYAKATVEETFERDFQIYDLGEFLGVLSMFSNPDIELREDHLLISSDSASAVYRYGDLDVFRPDPAKFNIYSVKVVMPSTDVNFALSQTRLQALQQACRLMKQPMVAFTSNGAGKVCAKVLDPKSPLSNTYSVELECETDFEFNFLYSIENLRLIPGDYEVSLSSKKIGLFKLSTPTSVSVEYYISPHTDSTFEESVQEDPPF